MSHLAACVQMRSGIDRAKNVQDAMALINDAADQGATFVVTPEMTNVLDQNPKRLFSHLTGEDETSEVGAFAEIAAQRQIWLLIGSMAIRADERRAHNRSYLFSPAGKVAATYDKIHMFDVALPDGETWSESKVYQPGTCAVTVQTPFGVLGLTICYDVRFPGLYRGLAQSGAQILCVPAAFTKQTGKAHWETLLRARAIENGAFVIAPNQGGLHEDGRETYGGSLIIGPWGDVLARAENDEPGVILARLELDHAIQARASIPNLALEPGYKILNVKV